MCGFVVFDAAVLFVYLFIFWDCEIRKLAKIGIKKSTSIIASAMGDTIRMYYDNGTKRVALLALLISLCVFIACQLSIPSHHPPHSSINAKELVYRLTRQYVSDRDVSVLPCSLPVSLDLIFVTDTTHEEQFQRLIATLFHRLAPISKIFRLDIKARRVASHS